MSITRVAEEKQAGEAGGWTPLRRLVERVRSRELKRRASRSMCRPSIFDRHRQSNIRSWNTTPSTKLRRSFVSPFQRDKKSSSKNEPTGRIFKDHGGNGKCWRLLEWTCPTTVHLRLSYFQELRDFLIPHKLPYCRWNALLDMFQALYLMQFYPFRFDVSSDFTKNKMRCFSAISVTLTENFDFISRKTVPSYRLIFSF